MGTGVRTGELAWVVGEGADIASDDWGLGAGLPGEATLGRGRVAGD